MSETRIPEVPFGELPPIIRVLYVSDEGDDWLERCLSEDSAVAVKIDTENGAESMKRLRTESYDCLVLHHQPGQWDALPAIGLIRTLVPNQPIVVLGDLPSEQFTAVCLEASADAYVCRAITEVRTLLWVLAGAIERQQLFVQRETLRAALQTQQRQQIQAALHQLRAQKSLLMEFASSDPHPPPWLQNQFLDLLKVYVVSGRGNPRAEVEQLVGTLRKSQVTLSEALLAHTFATEELVLGLGQRPAWHVVSRANLMAYELVMQMAEVGASERTGDHGCGAGGSVR